MSFRRKPESRLANAGIRVINQLETFWTPVFTGVTTFYEPIKIYSSGEN